MKKLAKRVSKTFLASTLLAVIIVGVSLLSDSLNRTADAKDAASDGAINQTVFKENVAYCNTPNPNQTLDAYLVMDSEEPSPVIIYIHGGGWS